ncbi:MAG: molybdopterin converting factor subunit 1 [Chloroflexota bacterium]
MRVKVLYFATLRARAGVREETLDLPDSATVAEVKSHLARQRPELEAPLQSAVVAVNRNFAQPEEALREGDEVAIFPPVSGGAGDSRTVLRLTEEPLDLNTVLQSLVLPTTGAACVFTGVVRARTERGEAHDTDHLEYEAYGPMAQEKLAQVVEEMRQRWPAVEGIAIIQRIGRLEVGTPTVLVAVTAAHRDSGVFEAARYGIDRLKEIVPIWKKEVGPAGETWVEGTYHPGEKDRQA